ncbi:MAG TPA: phosphatase PAP2 family protein [Thermoanaerobaculia bacterium]
MGIDLIRLACPLVGSALFERVMSVLDHLGHGLGAAALGLAVAVFGLATRNRRVLRAGLVVLLAVAMAGLLANGLKLVLQSPRPGHRVFSYGFPSGHATTAFAVAAVLGGAFPPAGPFLYFGALATGLARVYYRDHFVIDIVGGAVLGTACGLLLARWLLARVKRKTTPLVRWGWAAAAVVGIPAIAWFAVYEHELHRYLVKEGRGKARHHADVAIELGNPAARELLGPGWSGDERWNGTVPFVWAEGLTSTLRIPPLPPRDRRMRLRAIPFVRGEGLSCQVVEVDWNRAPVGRLLLDRGWNDYELEVPGRLIHSSDNEIEFRFGYATVASRRDPRRLAVAFHSVEIFPDEHADSH